MVRNDIYFLKRIFKMTLLVAAFFTSTIYARAADNLYQSPFLTLNINNKTIKEVFKEIEKNSEYVFFYYEGVLDVNRKVSFVYENQSVKSGEVIGYAGKTGRATTEHLHFEIRFLYEHFDPRIIIDFITFSLKTDTLYIRKGKFFGNSLNFTAEDMEKQMPDTAMITDNFQEEKFSLEDEKIKIDTIIPSKKEFYIVKKGDTLFSISKKTSVSIDVLCKINKIKQESILQIGQKLKLNSN